MHEQANKYTQAQREAMAAAYERAGVTGRNVVDLAAAGALTHPNGAKLDPFEATQSAVRTAAARARRAQAREVALIALSDMSPRDAVEWFRCRVGDLLEAEINRVEIEQAQGHPISPEHLRQLARAVREYQCIPGQNEPRTPKPGAKRDGVREGGETRGGIGAAILEAAETHFSS